MASRERRILMVAACVAGALLGGCRTPLVAEMEAPEPAPGDGVAFVRDMMIEAAKLSDGPSRSEKAVEAVVQSLGEAEDED